MKIIWSLVGTFCIPACRVLHELSAVMEEFAAKHRPYLWTSGLLIRSITSLIFVACCAAQPTPLTLENCVQLAINAPSSVASARQQVLIAKYGITAARAGFLPQLALANTYTYNSPLRNGAPGTAQSFVALNGIHEYSTLGTANLSLDTSGRLRAGFARAKSDLEAANVNFEISQRDLRRLVTTAYYRVLLARRLVEVARTTLAEAQEFESKTRARFSGGEVAQADVVKAAADVAALQLSFSNAETEGQLANHDLAAFWTTDVATLLDIEDTLDSASPVPEIPGATAQPYLKRLELRFFDAQRSGYLADARRARADLFPQLSLTYQYGIDSIRLSADDRGYAAFVHLDVPVFDWFRARSTARQFQLQADQVTTARKEAERTFSRDYQDALTRVEAARRQITISDDQVRLSTDNLRLARFRYEGGEGLALDVVSAQNQLAQARANHATAKAAYVNAKADLEIAAPK